VQWLPPQALRKELAMALALVGDAELDAAAARALAARFRDADGRESALFWNLVVLYERRRLPAAHLLWQLLGARTPHAGLAR
jgi:hypothetical protein